MKKLNKGFTLIELMVVVAVVGILVGVALPSYLDYILRAKRADAKAGLLQVRLAQEKWRANHTTYGDATDIGITTSPDGDYTIAHSGNTATGYRATATPSGFTDSTCNVFAINQDGKYYTGYANTTCWGK